MGVSLGSLSVVPWLLFAQMSWDMSAVPAITATPPSSRVVAEILDRGGVFSHGAERRARKALRQMWRDHPIPVLIETIDSLGKEAIDNAARRRAGWVGTVGIYILVAGRERDVAVVLGRHKTDGRPSDADRAAIREVFLGPLRADDADGGLEQGVWAIGTTLAAAAKPNSGVWNALISVSALLGLLVVVLATRKGQATEARADVTGEPHHPPRPAEKRCYRVEFMWIKSGSGWASTRSWWRCSRSTSASSTGGCETSQRRSIPPPAFLRANSRPRDES
jgi:uncharacterized membrane protein YgcG